MNIKNLLEQLKHYDGEQELIVEYWDKETVEGYGSPEMSAEQWSKVVTDYDNGEWLSQSYAAEVLVKLAEAIVTREG